MQNELRRKNFMPDGITVIVSFLFFVAAPEKLLQECRFKVIICYMGGNDVQAIKDIQLRAQTLAQISKHPSHEEGAMLLI